MRWSYGLITVRQRALTTLPETIESLARAGFDQPQLFVDRPEGAQLNNWRAALVAICEYDKHADRFAIFEDDLIACRNLRRYLERCDYPGKGYLNLLTHDDVLMTDAAGWQRSTQRGRGAVALVFDRAAAMTLLGDAQFAAADSKKGSKGADGLIVQAMRRHGFREWVHNPGLVQHVGEKSAIRERVPRHPIYGRVKSFIGEDADPLELVA